MCVCPAGSIHSASLYDRALTLSELALVTSACPLRAARRPRRQSRALTYERAAIDPSTETVIPTSAPTAQPTGTPTAEPSAQPSTATPSNVPTAEPSSAPSARPTTAGPTARPSAAPTFSPTVAPNQTPEPSATPTSRPTTAEPTLVPTGAPTAEPSDAPTGAPTSAPTFPVGLTAPPSAVPSSAPSAVPTSAPSAYALLTCPKDVLSSLAANHKTAGGTSVTFDGPQAVDYLGVDVSATVTCSPASGSLFARGSTNVTCSVPSTGSCRWGRARGGGGDAGWLAPTRALACTCSFRVTLPLAEYHFYAETAGARSEGDLIAQDRAGAMHLYASSRAAIVADAQTGDNVLWLSNAPVAPKPTDYVPAKVYSAARSGPASLSGRSLVAYVRPSTGSSLGQQAGGEERTLRAADADADAAAAARPSGIMAFHQDGGAAYDAFIAGDESVSDPTWTSVPIV
jgi:hypothetical protein